MGKLYQIVQASGADGLHLSVMQRVNVCGRCWGVVLAVEMSGELGTQRNDCGKARLHPLKNAKYYMLFTDLLLLPRPLACVVNIPSVLIGPALAEVASLAAAAGTVRVPISILVPGINAAAANPVLDLVTVMVGQEAHASAEWLEYANVHVWVVAEVDTDPGNSSNRWTLGA